MSRRRIKGAASFRRLLRRLPDAAREELGGYLQASGQALLGRARAETPRRTGKLANALAARVAKRSLRLRLGLLTKARQSRFFYGYILDQGRRAQTVTVRRLRKGGRDEWTSRISRGMVRRSAGKPRDLVTSYKLRVSPIASSRYEFVFGRRRDFVLNELPKIGAVLDRILARVSRGGGE